MKKQIIAYCLAYLARHLASDKNAYDATHAKLAYAIANRLPDENQEESVRQHNLAAAGSAAHDLLSDFVSEFVR